MVTKKMVILYYTMELMEHKLKHRLYGTNILSKVKTYSETKYILEVLVCCIMIDNHPKVDSHGGLRLSVRKRLYDAHGVLILTSML